MLELLARVVCGYGECAAAIMEVGVDRRLGYLRSQAEGAMAAHDFAGAADVFRQLIAELHYAVGPLDYETLVARFELGICMMNSGQWYEAVGLFKELAPTFERRGLSRLSLESSGNLAACLANTGDYSSAVRIFEHLIPELERAFGYDSENAFTARHNLIVDLAELGKKSQAFRQVNKLISDLERARSPVDFLIVQARETREWIKRNSPRRFGF